MFLYNIFIPCLIETQSRARLDGLTAQIRQAGHQLMITGLYPYCPTISDYYRKWINITFSLLFFKLHKASMYIMVAGCIIGADNVACIHKDNHEFKS